MEVELWPILSVVTNGCFDEEDIRINPADLSVDAAKQKVKSVNMIAMPLLLL
jgi:hypothetical protein